MNFSPLITQLIDSLKVLPGVGPKTAQRMALHLLERNPEGAKQLASSVELAVEKVGRCPRCRNLTEEPLCGICRSSRRDPSILCVVESPTDVMAIEMSGGYSGRYFVLMGHLSPIDGIGPQDIGIDELETLLSEGDIKELILATNPTVEGEATAHFVAEKAKQYQVVTSRIAHGVPLGGELEFVDGGTLTHAFSGRKVMN